MAVPEFLQKNRMPSIRLRAPHSKSPARLRRAVKTSVKIVLLSGQNVHVECRADCTAGEIFDLIVGHIHLTEHVFFGLSTLIDGEHFFLSRDEKLAHFAPPNWKVAAGSHRTGPILDFVLYLRIKLYPQKLDFVKTDSTMHELYLQLRRDLLDERLQCDASTACLLAPLAMQAECGDRPGNFSSCDYFSTEHYLSHRHRVNNADNGARVKTVLAEMHGTYAGTSKRDAEREFLLKCLPLKEYGVHFYRVYRQKPSANMGNTPLGDPQTGTSIWIGISPNGLGFYEESLGSRVARAHYAWLQIQALKHNHKKFTVVLLQDPRDAVALGAMGQIESQGPSSNLENTIDAGANFSPDGTAQSTAKFVFWTDNYLKCRQFVHFSESQHHFGIKQRLWAEKYESSNNNNIGAKNGAGAKNSAILALAQGANEDRPIDVDPEAFGRRDRRFGELGNGRMSTDSGAPDLWRETSPGAMVNGAGASNFDGTRVIDTSIASRDRTLRDKSDVTAMIMERLNAAGHSESEGISQDPVLSSMNLTPNVDYMTFTVRITKDAKYGLGLTLVDGELQGLKGVYVKSLVAGGPASQLALDGVNALKIGDKLEAVNGVSLANKNRHDAVNLVRQADTYVTMDVLRLTGLTSAQQQSASDDGKVPKGDISSKKARMDENVEKGRPATRSSNDDSGVERANKPKAPMIRQRALTDMGTNGGLPTFNTADLLFDQNNKEIPAKSGEMKSTGYGSAEQGDDSLQNGSKKFSTSLSMLRGAGVLDTPEPRRNKHHQKSPSKNHRPISSSSQSSIEDKTNQNFKENKFQKTADAVNLDGTLEISSKYVQNRSTAMGNRQREISRGSDWTEQLDMESGDEVEQLTVVLHKGNSGSLGIKIAGSRDHIYIKALTAPPATECPLLRTGDRLVAVNQRLTRGMGHQEVVLLLKSAQSPVTLVLERTVPSQDSTGNDEAIGGQIEGPSQRAVSITVTKSAGESLGLSLATSSSKSNPLNSSQMHENQGETHGKGVYISAISATGVCGRLGDNGLRLGDQLMEIDSENVLQSSPQHVLAVLGQLKEVAGPVNIKVLRQRQMQMEN